MSCKKNIILFVIISLFLSCSFYSFKGSLPPNVNSIYFSPVVNLTSEYILTNILNNKINDRLISENILDVVDFTSTDSQLDVTIITSTDKPNIYHSQDDNYERVEQWKLKIDFKIIWYNITNDEIIIDNKVSEWAMYNNSGIDISNDGIDNDNDGFTDSEDSDEFGSPREAAIRIITDKITDRVLNELISIW